MNCALSEAVSSLGRRLKASSTGHLFNKGLFGNSVETIFMYFFLVVHNFSPSECSSSIEYNFCCLGDFLLRVHKAMELHLQMQKSFKSYVNVTCPTIISFSYGGVILWNPASLSWIRISFYGHVRFLMKTQFLWSTLCRRNCSNESNESFQTAILYTRVSSSFFIILWP